MVHSNLTFGGMNHLHRSRARVENQLGSTGARTDKGKKRISFSGPTIFNSLGCNIGHGAAIIGVREFATWKISAVTVHRIHDVRYSKNVFDRNYV
jgi:hypothetical protein